MCSDTAQMYHRGSVQAVEAVEVYILGRAGFNHILRDMKVQSAAIEFLKCHRDNGEALLLHHAPHTRKKMWAAAIDGTGGFTLS